MDADEKDIFHYLKTWGSQFVSAKEVCRRASSKKRYNEDQDWAKTVLVRMAERHILETDASGRYRVKPTAKKGHERWVSPEIAKMLAEKGVEIEDVEGAIAPDEHYEQL
jgi:hypothetical protein